MECLEFRRIAGADPQHLEPAAREHAAQCSRCAEHLRQLLALDQRILAALQIPVPVPGQVSLPRPGAGVARPGRPAFPGLDRRRWMAFAASIVAGVLVGTLLWVGGPRNSLAEDVLEHLNHERDSIVATTRPADAVIVDAVLERGGIRLQPGAGLVSYANSCRFRGHSVPHLVVQTASGPVTVMVLRHEQAAAPVTFAEEGFSGRIVPAGPGSIAVVGATDADLELVAARVQAAVEWL